MGVTMEVVSGRSAGVEIADAFMIGQEEDAVADPHWSCDIAFQLDQPPKFARAVRVYPEISGGASAIPLPARRIVVVPAYHGPIARRDRDRHRQATGQRSGSPPSGLTACTKFHGRAVFRRPC